MAKKDAEKTEVENPETEEPKTANAKMAEKPEAVKKPTGEGDAKMAEAKMGEQPENPAQPPQIPELASVKIAYLATKQIDIQTSPNMTYGMAIELLEAALQRLKSAPLKY